MLTHVTVDSPFTILLANDDLVLTRCRTNLYYLTVKDTHRGHLTATVYVLPYIATTNINCRAHTHTTGKLHWCKGVGICIVVSSSTWICHTRFWFLHREDRILSVLTSVTATIDIAPDSTVIDGHFGIVTDRTQLTTTIDTAFDERVVAANRNF